MKKGCGEDEGTRGGGGCCCALAAAQGWAADLILWKNDVALQGQAAALAALQKGAWH